MATRPKKFKGPSHNIKRELEYYYEYEQKDPDHNVFYNHSIYDQANRLQEIRTFDLKALEPKEQLEQICDEIKVRIKITKDEIFKIGELLLIAKKICQEAGTGFKDWINKNFDFSYETAHNFINVFQQCMGRRSIALKVPTSVLYKISAPNFPDRLRNFLLDKGNLEKLTNGSLKNLVSKYREGGIEAVEDEVTQLNRGSLIFRQMNFTFDQTENAIRVLEDLRDKIEGRYSKYVSYEDQIKQHEPEASEINSKLFNAIKTSITSLETALSESRNVLHRYWEKVGK